MSKLLGKIKTLLGAAPTYLTGAAVIVAALSEEIAKVAPSGAAEDITHVGVVVLAGLGAAVAIVRRVTPVIAALRGLDPGGV